MRLGMNKIAVVVVTMVSVTEIGGIPHWKYLVEAVAWLGPSPISNWTDRGQQEFSLIIIMLPQAHLQGDAVTFVRNFPGTPDKQLP